MRRLKFYFLISLLLITGCSVTPSCVVSVDSISAINNDDNEKNKYILLPGNKECKKYRLQFNEFSKYTDIVLQDNGFVKVEDANKADVAIFLSYKIDGPHHYNYTYSVPHYGQTGISSSHTSGTAHHIGNLNTYYSTDTTYTPEYGVTGYSTHIGTSVYFVRYMKLESFDLNKYKKTKNINDLRELWIIKAQSTGSSGDLREIFPVMLVASSNKIAKNSYGKVTYEIKLDDPYLKILYYSIHDKNID